MNNYQIQEKIKIVEKLEDYGVLFKMHKRQCIFDEAYVTVFIKNAILKNFHKNSESYFCEGMSNTPLSAEWGEPDNNNEYNDDGYRHKTFNITSFDGKRDRSEEEVIEICRKMYENIYQLVLNLKPPLEERWFKFDVVLVQ